MNPLPACHSAAGCHLVNQNSSHFPCEFYEFINKVPLLNCTLIHHQFEKKYASDIDKLIEWNDHLKGNPEENISELLLTDKIFQRQETADHSPLISLLFLSSLGHCSAILKKTLDILDFSDPRIDQNIKSFFLLSCLNEHAETIELLVRHPQIDINSLYSEGNTLLHLAYYHNKKVAVEHLLQSKHIAVNRQNRLLETPLFIACKNHVASQVLKPLLATSMIEVNRTNLHGETPFFIACKKGAVDKVKLLLKHPDIDINQPNYLGMPPLIKCCYKQEPEVVNLLLNLIGLNLNPQITTSSTNYNYIQPAPIDPIELMRRNQWFDLAAYAEKIKKIKPSDYIFPLFFYLSQGYVSISHNGFHPELTRAKRFFDIAKRLPINLQIILANRYANSCDDFILAEPVYLAFSLWSRHFDNSDTTA